MDNMMPGMYSDPADVREWKQANEEYCSKCNHFAEMCDCGEQAQIGKVDAVLCPYCQQTVLDTDDATVEHQRDCSLGYEEEW